MHARTHPRRSEADIRQHVAAAAADSSTAPPQPPQQQQQQLPVAAPPAFAVPSPELFARWFPGLRLSGTPCDAAPAAGVVLCLHAAGTAEDVFTSEGTGSRRAPSPLLELCRRRGWKLLAAQLPGRGQRMREPPLATMQVCAVRASSLA